MLIGESNVAIDPAIGGYGVADIYLGEFSPQLRALTLNPAPPFSTPTCTKLVRPKFVELTNSQLN